MKHKFIKKNKKTTEHTIIPMEVDAAVAAWCKAHNKVLPARVSMRMLTPELARYVQRKGMPPNRDVTARAKIERLKNDILSNQWEICSMIVTDPDDFLLDGQYRCAAVIETNTAVPVVMLQGVPRHAISKIDKGLKRTITADLYMTDKKLRKDPNLNSIKPINNEIIKILIGDKKQEVVTEVIKACHSWYGSYNKEIIEQVKGYKELKDAWHKAIFSVIACAYGINNVVNFISEVKVGLEVVARNERAQDPDKAGTKAKVKVLASPAEKIAERIAFIANQRQKAKYKNLYYYQVSNAFLMWLAGEEAHTLISSTTGLDSIKAVDAQKENIELLRAEMLLPPQKVQQAEEVVEIHEKAKEVQSKEDDRQAARSVHEAEV